MRACRKTEMNAKLISRFLYTHIRIKLPPSQNIKIIKVSQVLQGFFAGRIKTRSSHDPPKTKQPSQK